jgi:hypothetical protein
MSDPTSKERGKIVTCAACGVKVLLPFVRDGEVSIEKLDGWTAPPLRCPACQEESADD